MASVSESLQNILDTTLIVARAPANRPLYLTAAFTQSEIATDAVSVSTLISNLQGEIHATRSLDELPIAKKIFAMLKLISSKNRDISRGVEPSSFEPLIQKTIELAAERLLAKAALKEQKQVLVNRSGDRFFGVHLTDSRLNDLRVNLMLLTAVKEYIQGHSTVALRTLDVIQYRMNSTTPRFTEIFLGSEPSSPSNSNKTSVYIQSVDSLAFYFRWFVHDPSTTRLIKLKPENVEDFKTRYLNHDDSGIRKLAEICLRMHNRDRVQDPCIDSLYACKDQTGKRLLIPDVAKVANMQLPQSFLKFLETDHYTPIAKAETETAAQSTLQEIRQSFLPLESNLNELYAYIYRDHQWFDNKKAVKYSPEQRGKFDDGREYSYKLPLVSPSVTNTGVLLDPNQFAAIPLIPTFEKIETQQKPLSKGKYKPVCSSVEMKEAESVLPVEDTSPLDEVFRTGAFPNGILYHTRCLDWFSNPDKALSRPEYKSIQSNEVRGKIRLFHSFTTQLDSLVGTSYSQRGSWVNSQTGKEDKSYMIPVQITLGAETFYGTVGYTFDSKTGVCYHRCITEKDNAHFISQWNKIDYPTLQESAKLLTKEKGQKRVQPSKESKPQFDEDSESIVFEEGPMTIRAFKLGN